MDPFSLEITVRRIGGSDVSPRQYGPWTTTVHPGIGARESVNAYGASRGEWMTVGLERWTLVRPGLLSATLSLFGINGETLAVNRPVLHSVLASDVALYSTHVAAYEELGVYSVGLRSPRSAWTTEDQAIAEEAVAGA